MSQDLKRTNVASAVKWQELVRFDPKDIHCLDEPKSERMGEGFQIMRCRRICSANPDSFLSGDEIRKRHDSGGVEHDKSE